MAANATLRKNAERSIGRSPAPERIVDNPEFGQKRPCKKLNCSGRIAAHLELGTLCARPSVVAGWSGRRVADDPVKGRPGGFKAHRPRRHGPNGRGTRPSCRAEASPLCAYSFKAHRPRRHGPNGRGTRPSCRAEASPLCAYFFKAHRPRRHGSSGRGTRPSCRAEASPVCAVPQKALFRNWGRR